MSVAAPKPPVSPGTPAPAAAKPVATGPSIRRLKKGELLFAEGENSKSMYFLKVGLIRIFKKKGDSDIEIDTIRSGQVLGELAFLDGNPRSASGEALAPCELVEINAATFQAVLVHMPDWLKILLKAIVGRLRTASTRIRQLETASTAFDYSDKDGKRAQHYIYLSPNDVLKIASALLLVASRHGEAGVAGIGINIALLQRYGNQVMGVPVAKITSFLDLLAQCGSMKIADDQTTTLTDIDFLEKFIGYYNEENLVEPSKRKDISLKGFLIMSLIAKYVKDYPVEAATGNAKVNLAAIKKAETTPAGKEPFRMDELEELMRLGYIGPTQLRSPTEVYAEVHVERFTKAFKMQRMIMAIAQANEQKRKGGKAA